MRTKHNALVLKADNGSSFIAGSFMDLLVQHRVATLFSPPVIPQYNGSIEAGNGSLKAHARLEAVRHGRVVWTCDDAGGLEAACTCANTFARSWGQNALTPAQRWHARSPITPRERERFWKTFAEMKEHVRRESNLRPEDLEVRAVRATVERTAIRETLIRLAYLFVARGPIRPLLKSKTCQFIR